MQRTSMKENLLDIKIPFQPKQQEALNLSYTTPVTFYGGAKRKGEASHF